MRSLPLLVLGICLIYQATAKSQSPIDSGAVTIEQYDPEEDMSYLPESIDLTGDPNSENADDVSKEEDEVDEIALRRSPPIAPIKPPVIGANGCRTGICIGSSTIDLTFIVEGKNHKVWRRFASQLINKLQIAKFRVRVNMIMAGKTPQMLFDFASSKGNIVSKINKSVYHYSGSQTALGEALHFYRKRVLKNSRRFSGKLLLVLTSANSNSGRAADPEVARLKRKGVTIMPILIGYNVVKPYFIKWASSGKYVWLREFSSLHFVTDAFLHMKINWKLKLSMDRVLVCPKPVTFKTACKHGQRHKVRIEFQNILNSCKPITKVLKSKTCGCSGGVCFSSQPMELIIVLQASHSIGTAHFNYEKDFVINLIKQMNIGSGHIRVSLITFSSAARIEFQLSKYHTQKEVIEGIEHVHIHKESQCAIGEALFTIHEVLKHSIEENAKMVILVTSSGSNFGRSVEIESKRLEEIGVSILVIGVGNEITIDEITVISEIYIRITTWIKIRFASKYILRMRILFQVRPRVHGRLVIRCPKYTKVSYTKCSKGFRYKTTKYYKKQHTACMPFQRKEKLKCTTPKPCHEGTKFSRTKCHKNTKFFVTTTITTRVVRICTGKGHCVKSCVTKKSFKRIRCPKPKKCVKKRLQLELKCQKNGFRHLYWGFYESDGSLCKLKSKKVIKSFPCGGCTTTELIHFDITISKECVGNARPVYSSLYVSHSGKCKKISYLIRKKTCKTPKPCKRLPQIHIEHTCTRKHNQFRAIYISFRRRLTNNGPCQRIRGKIIKLVPCGGCVKEKLSEEHIVEGKECKKGQRSIYITFYEGEEKRRCVKHKVSIKKRKCVDCGDKKIIKKPCSNGFIRKYLRTYVVVKGKCVAKFLFRGKEPCITPTICPKPHVKETDCKDKSEYSSKTTTYYEVHTRCTGLIRPPVQGCTAVADLVFVLDTSTSIQSEDFVLSKQFVQKIVGSLNVSPKNVRVALITYSHKTKLEFNLDRFNSKSQINNAINKLHRYEGLTFTANAIKLVNQKVFPKRRAGVPFVVMVITDGKSTYGDPIAEAKKLKSKGAKFITVGIYNSEASDTINPAELKGISSTNSYYRAKDFKNLKVIADQVTKRTCKDMGSSGSGSSTHGKKICKKVCVKKTKTIKKKCIEQQIVCHKRLTSTSCSGNVVYRYVYEITYHAVGKVCKPKNKVQKQKLRCPPIRCPLPKKHIKICKNAKDFSTVTVIIYVPKTVCTRSLPPQCKQFCAQKKLVTKSSCKCKPPKTHVTECSKTNRRFRVVRTTYETRKAHHCIKRTAVRKIPCPIICPPTKKVTQDCIKGRKSKTTTITSYSTSKKCISGGKGKLCYFVCVKKRVVQKVLCPLPPCRSVRRVKKCSNNSVFRLFLKVQYKRVGRGSCKPFKTIILKKEKCPPRDCGKVKKTIVPCKPGEGYSHITIIIFYSKIKCDKSGCTYLCVSKVTTKTINCKCPLPKSHVTSCSKTNRRFRVVRTTYHERKGHHCIKKTKEIRVACPVKCPKSVKVTKHCTKGRKSKETTVTSYTVVKKCLRSGKDCYFDCIKKVHKWAVLCPLPPCKFKIITKKCENHSVYRYILKDKYRRITNIAKCTKYLTVVVKKIKCPPRKCGKPKKIEKKCQPGALSGYISIIYYSVKVKCTKSDCKYICVKRIKTRHFSCKCPRPIIRITKCSQTKNRYRVIKKIFYVRTAHKCFKKTSIDSTPCPIKCPKSTRTTKHCGNGRKSKITTVVSYTTKKVCDIIQKVRHCYFKCVKKVNKFGVLCPIPPCKSKLTVRKCVNHSVYQYIIRTDYRRATHGSVCRAYRKKTIKTIKCPQRNCGKIRRIEKKCTSQEGTGHITIITHYTKISCQGTDCKYICLSKAKIKGYSCKCPHPSVKVTRCSKTNSKFRIIQRTHYSRQGHHCVKKITNLRIPCPITCPTIRKITKHCSKTQHTRVTIITSYTKEKKCLSKLCHFICVKHVTKHGVLCPIPPCKSRLIVRKCVKHSAYKYVVKQTFRRLKYEGKCIPHTSVVVKRLKCPPRKCAKVKKTIKPCKPGASSGSFSVIEEFVHIQCVKSDCKYICLKRGKSSTFSCKCPEPSIQTTKCAKGRRYRVIRKTIHVRTHHRCVKKTSIVRLPCPIVCPKGHKKVTPCKPGRTHEEMELVSYTVGKKCPKNIACFYICVKKTIKAKRACPKPCKKIVRTIRCGKFSINRAILEIWRERKGAFCKVIRKKITKQPCPPPTCPKPKKIVKSCKEKNAKYRETTLIVHTLGKKCYKKQCHYVCTKKVVTARVICSCPRPHITSNKCTKGRKFRHVTTTTYKNVHGKCVKKIIKKLFPCIPKCPKTHKKIIRCPDGIKIKESLVITSRLKRTCKKVGQQLLCFYSCHQQIFRTKGVCEKKRIKCDKHRFGGTLCKNGFRTETYEWEKRVGDSCVWKKISKRIHCKGCTPGQNKYHETTVGEKCSKGQVAQYLVFYESREEKQKLGHKWVCHKTKVKTTVIECKCNKKPIVLVDKTCKNGFRQITRIIFESDEDGNCKQKKSVTRVSCPPPVKCHNRIIVTKCKNHAAFKTVTEVIYVNVKGKCIPGGRKLKQKIPCPIKCPHPVKGIKRCTKTSNFGYTSVTVFVPKVTCTMSLPPQCTRRCVPKTTTTKFSCKCPPSKVHVTKCSKTNKRFRVVRTISHVRRAHHCVTKITISRFPCPVRCPKGEKKTRNCSKGSKYRETSVTYYTIIKKCDKPKLCYLHCVKHVKKFRVPCELPPCKSKMIVKKCTHYGVYRRILQIIYKRVGRGSCKPYKTVLVKKITCPPPTCPKTKKIEKQCKPGASSGFITIIDYSIKKKCDKSVCKYHCHKRVHTRHFSCKCPKPSINLTPCKRGSQSCNFSVVRRTYYVRTAKHCVKKTSVLYRPCPVKCPKSVRVTQGCGNGRKYKVTTITSYGTNKKCIKKGNKKVCCFVCSKKVNKLALLCPLPPCQNKVQIKKCTNHSVYRYILKIVYKRKNHRAPCTKHKSVIVKKMKCPKRNCGKFKRIEKKCKPGSATGHVSIMTYHTKIKCTGSGCKYICVSTVKVNIYDCKCKPPTVRANKCNVKNRRYRTIERVYYVRKNHHCIQKKSRVHIPCPIKCPKSKRTIQHCSCKSSRRITTVISYTTKTHCKKLNKEKICFFECVKQVKKFGVVCCPPPPCRSKLVIKKCTKNSAFRYIYKEIYSRKRNCDKCTRRGLRLIKKIKCPFKGCPKPTTIKKLCKHGVTNGHITIIRHITKIVCKKGLCTYVCVTKSLTKRFSCKCKKPTVHITTCKNKQSRFRIIKRVYYERRAHICIKRTTVLYEPCPIKCPKNTKTLLRDCSDKHRSRTYKLTSYTTGKKCIVKDKKRLCYFECVKKVVKIGVSCPPQPPCKHKLIMTKCSGYVVYRFIRKLKYRRLRYGGKCVPHKTVIVKKLKCPPRDCGSAKKQVKKCKPGIAVGHINIIYYYTKISCTKNQCHYICLTKVKTNIFSCKCKGPSVHISHCTKENGFVRTVTRTYYIRVAHRCVKKIGVIKTLCHINCPKSSKVHIPCKPGRTHEEVRIITWTVGRSCPKNKVCQQICKKRTVIAKRICLKPCKSSKTIVKNCKPGSKYREIKKVVYYRTGRGPCKSKVVNIRRIPCKTPPTRICGKSYYSLSTCFGGVRRLLFIYSKKVVKNRKEICLRKTTVVAYMDCLPKCHHGVQKKLVLGCTCVKNQRSLYQITFTASSSRCHHDVKILGQVSCTDCVTYMKRYITWRFKHRPVPQTLLPRPRPKPQTLPPRPRPKPQTQPLRPRPKPQTQPPRPRPKPKNRKRLLGFSSAG